MGRKGKAHRRRVGKRAGSLSTMGRGRKIVLVADRALRESNMIKCIKSL